MKRIIVLLLMLLIVTSCSEDGKTTNGGIYQTISCNEAINKSLKDAIIIDVRTEEEYLSGNLTDSINIPLDDLEDKIKLYANYDREIIVYCRSGSRSKQAAELLLSMGYKYVYDLGAISNCGS